MSDLDTIPEHKKKFFIMTPGRSGSSLLSGFLADAGGQFAADHKDSWNPLAGAFEDEAVDRFVFLLIQAHRLQTARQYSPFYRYFYKKIVTLNRFRAKRQMRRIFSRSSYFKSGGLDYAARLSANMGYWPVVILNCRPYDAWTGSMYPGEVGHTIASLTANYVACLRNSLADLGLFGGCVVNYGDIMDANSTLWAENLGKVTGLNPDALLESRRKRLREPGPETQLPVRNAEAEALYDHILEYAGKVVPPSPAAVRRWLT